MSLKQKGYNFIFTVNGLKYAGTQENTFGITPKTKESITKDDNGQMQIEADGYDSEITVKGICALAETGEALTHIDFTDLREAVKAGTKLTCVYGGKASGAATESGTYMITSYSESSGSEDYASFDATFKLDGALTTGTRTV